MSGCEGSSLARVRLFSGLSVQDLDAIARRGVQRVLPSRTVFIHEGEESAALFLILSGKVKVYTSNADGNEAVLAVRGAGDHLGELALLGDSVRTASAVTLEETTCLVLSRRAFLECLGENPRIALNLDDARLVRWMETEIGSGAAARYRAWSTFRRSGLPLILLIGGCSGTGKSTVAAELSLRLDIGRTQATDLLREVMRLYVPRSAAPELHASTYVAWKSGEGAEPDMHRDGTGLINGFRAQVNRLVEAIDGVIARSIKERASTIIEGVHVHPAYQEHWARNEALVVPILLTIPNRDELKRHLALRGQRAPTRGAENYLEHFESIWRLQAHLVEEAMNSGVPVIPNVHLDETVRRVMAAITDEVTQRVLPVGP